MTNVWAVKALVRDVKVGDVAFQLYSETVETGKTKYYVEVWDLGRMELVDSVEAQDFQNAYDVLWG